jgi:hypothetical protein
MAETLTFAQQMLTAIEAALLARATQGQLDMIKAAFGDRSIDRQSGELIALRDKFKIEVAQEQLSANLAAGAGLPGRVRVRF